MKKYKRYFMVIFLITFMQSCEDYLTTSSPSVFTEETAFTNLDFSMKAVFGIYERLTHRDFYSYYEIFSRYDTDIEVEYRVDDGSQRSMNHYSTDSDWGSLANMWNIRYETIERANICIDNLPNSPIWEGEFAGEARRLYGEAVTLRALTYFGLIKLWGDVPFTVKSTQAGDDIYLPKTDRDSIYEYLIQELKDIEDFVPWMTGTAERVNKAFVKGLRARMALTYSGFSLRNNTLETRRGRNWEEYIKIANQECLEIIESGRHNLNPDFGNIFKTLSSYSQDLNNKEVLFEIAHGRFTNGRLGAYFGMRFHSNDPKYGRSSNQCKIPISYYYSFDRADRRRNVSVELFEYNDDNYLGMQRLVPSSGAELAPCKWRRSWINPSMGGDYRSNMNTGVNFPEMRYADILLMYAETENELNNGPTPEAKNALSLIRKRAFPESSWSTGVVNYIESVSGNKEDFFNAIVNERAWEFGGEFIRKNDLIRWNLLGPKIRQMKDEVIKIINNDPEYANLVPDYVFWKYEDDNETLDILNPDYRLPSTPIDGYTRTSWFPRMSENNRNSLIAGLNNIAHGYDEQKNNHLNPLPSGIIAASQGILTDDQIP